MTKDSVDTASLKQLIKKLQSPIKRGGTNSEDAYEVYDDLRLEAAKVIIAMSKALAAIPKPDQEPVGWKLVPIEPTEAMLEAMHEVGSGFPWGIYQAGVAAAPALAPKPDQEQRLREALEDIRLRQVQALHAAFSRRDWHAAEKAGNELRDRIDRALSDKPETTEPAAMPEPDDLAEELESLRAERDEWHGIWPEWADQIRKLLIKYGYEGDEGGHDLPKDLADWLEGFAAMPEPVGGVVEQHLTNRSDPIVMLRHKGSFHRTPLYTTPPSVDRAVKEEREACARIAEEGLEAMRNYSGYGHQDEIRICEGIADRIRSRTVSPSSAPIEPKPADNAEVGE